MYNPKKTILISLIGFVCFFQTMLISVPRKKKEPSLYEKLTGIQKEADTNNLKIPVTERRKYELLYREVVADATTEEKIKKAVAIGLSTFLAWSGFLASLDKPVTALSKQMNTDHAPQIAYLLNLIPIGLLYYYGITPDRMSPELFVGSASLLTAVSYKGSKQPATTLRGFAWYTVISNIILTTTREKLADFLDRDEQEWTMVLRNLPASIKEEIEKLHTDYIKYNTVLLSDPELTRFVKKITFGAKRKRI